MKTDIEYILKELEVFGDEKYRLFNAKIIPTKQIMIGVRVPILRKIAKEIINHDAVAFLRLPKQNIYELVLLEGIVLSYCKFHKHSSTFTFYVVLKL